jgi:hypothetical protein
MASTPEQIGAAAPGYSYIPDKLAAIIYLLNSNNMTPEQIAVGAACYGYIPDKMAAILYLLANSGSGGGGTTQLVTYTSGSPAAPPNTSQPALAYDPNGILPQYGWDVATQQWN